MTEVAKVVLIIEEVRSVQDIGFLANARILNSHTQCLSNGTWLRVNDNRENHRAWLRGLHWTGSQVGLQRGLQRP